MNGVSTDNDVYYARIVFYNLAFSVGVLMFLIGMLIISPRKIINIQGQKILIYRRFLSPIVMNISHVSLRRNVFGQIIITNNRIRVTRPSWILSVLPFFEDRGSN